MKVVTPFTIVRIFHGMSAKLSTPSNSLDQAAPKRFPLAA